MIKTLRIFSANRRLLNLGLRALTLGARFVFMIALARHLDPDLVGYYGLFAAAIGYALYCVGLDFYAYMGREILAAPHHARGQMLRGQIVLSGWLYTLVLPVAIGMLLMAEWPFSLILFFAPILLLEHFNQEISRILIVLSHQTAASLVLFLRQGTWALVAIVLLSFEPEYRSLEAVLGLWVVGGLSAAFVGGKFIQQMDFGGWCEAVDWKWLRNGVAVCSGFLIATLAVRGILTIDRYWLEAVSGLEVVAAYVLFMGIASALLAFLDAGVFAYAYPDMIRLAKDGDEPGFRKMLRRSLVQVLLISLLFGGVSWAVLPLLLDWIGNTVYEENIAFFPLILTAMAINGLSMVPHYALYAKNRDSQIIFSHVFGLVAFFVGTWSISNIDLTLAIPIGLNISFLVILVIKSAAYLSIVSKPQLESAD